MPDSVFIFVVLICIDAIGYSYHMLSDDLYFRQVCAARLAWLCRTRNTVWSAAEGHYESAKAGEMIEASIIYEDLFASVSVLHDDHDFKDAMSHWYADYVMPGQPIEDYFEWAWGDDEKSGQLNVYTQTIFLTFAQQHWGDMLTPFIDILPLPNRPPEGTIESPVNFGTFSRGDTVSFTASAVDPEGGACTYSWEILGMRFSGQTIQVPFPYSGEYTVYMTAIDQEGYEDQTPASIQITIEQLPADGHDLSFDGLVSTVPSAPDQGDEVEFSFSVTNNGIFTEQAFALLFVTGPSGSNIDEQYDSYAIGAISPQETMAVMRQLSYDIVSAAPSGLYTFTIKLVSDSGDQYPEDNIRTLSLQDGGPEIIRNAYSAMNELTLQWSSSLNLTSYGAPTVGGYGWGYGDGYSFAAGPLTDHGYIDLVAKRSSTVVARHMEIEEGVYKILDSGRLLFKYANLITHDHAWIHYAVPTTSITMTPENAIVEVGNPATFTVYLGTGGDDLEIREYFPGEDVIFNSDPHPSINLDYDDTSTGFKVTLTPEVAGVFPFVLVMDDDDSKDYFVFGELIAAAPPPDSDSDGVIDSIDAFANDPAASIDEDGDSYPDCWNPGENQADSTTVLTLDAFPGDFSEWMDTDGDGIGDNADKFPDDPAASVDSDGDGSPDIWNIGKTVLDSTTGLKLDRFPNNPNEWADSDLDGVGDNSDWAPDDPYEWADSDGDGVGDNSDVAPNDSGRWDNTNPQIEKILPFFVNIGETREIVIVASDPDNDVVSLSLLVGPEFVSLSGFP